MVKDLDFRFFIPFCTIQSFLAISNLHLFTTFYDPGALVKTKKNIAKESFCNPAGS